MNPQDEGDFSGETIRQERLGLYNSVFQPHVQSSRTQSLYTHAKNSGVRGEILTDFDRLVLATEEELIPFLERPEDASNVKRSIEQAVQALTTQIMANLQPTQQYQLRFASTSSGRPVPFLKQEDIAGGSKPSWGQSEIFQQSFSRLFVAYRDLSLSNRAARLAKLEGESDVSCLTDVDFETLYGPPPWDFVNTSLRAAGLDFTINSPDRFSFNPYKARLRKRGTNAEILFNDLSSGERVLMSFAFAPLLCKRHSANYKPSEAPAFG